MHKKINLCECSKNSRTKYQLMSNVQYKKVMIGNKNNTILKIDIYRYKLINHFGLIRQCLHVLFDNFVTLSAVKNE